MQPEQQPTCGWGRYPILPAVVHRARWLQDLVNSGETTLAQGRLRSYGDAGLAEVAISTLSLNRFLDFDAETGILEVEAGLTLDEILRFIVPRGWFLPVTPGTKHPTIGGCVAADVHGKNHHADGSFYSHVEAMTLATAEGQILRCCRQEHADLFSATFGGMGLTGYIYAVRLRLLPISSDRIDTVTYRTADLQQTCDLLSSTQSEYRYSVAWVDLLSRRRRGRGLVMLGDHGSGSQLAPHTGDGLPVPLLPEIALSRWPLRLGNIAYYRRQWTRERRVRVHYDRFFYPLDGLRAWNRAYGRRGFLQYQFVVPFEGGLSCIERFLDQVGEEATCSLAVLKSFGDGPTGPLGFPEPGWTLALDYPRTDRTIRALRDATSVIREAGGRIYLAKDAILEPTHFQGMYSQLEEFVQIKKRYDPHNRLRSAQSDRLGIT
ncbi:MAG: FAD-binding oxidoreductase [Gemmatimonadetes bacterium]|nr:FAD-binding oxidoreductase [Gemmatimonadota bacterium]MBT7862112.1 FAD-binding oxidoreductase [Gemmatimonadota bacterium]